MFLLTDQVILIAQISSSSVIVTGLLSAMIISDEEQMILKKITEDLMILKILHQTDKDHVLHDTMSQVLENGVK